jgi:protein-S-isoprenylcysteine O-methyltransferase Ste14
MINHFIATFIKAAQKQYSMYHRVIILIATIGLIFLFFPLFYLYTGYYAQSTLIASLPTMLKLLIALPLLFISSTMIIWTLILQYSYGKGSGSHLIPTQELIIHGPYKVCRHPMLLSSAMLYFATGILFSTLFIAFYGALATLIAGYFFVIYIEEPVLIARFGNNYKQYQAQVPIIPFFT